METVWRDSVWRDLVLAARLLRKTPGFTLAAVLTLAIGIAASTAVFSVVNAALLRPYPYIDADRWANLYEQPRNEGLSGGGGMSVSTPNYRDWKQQSQSFAAMALYFGWTYNLSGSEQEPERVRAIIITPDVFGAFGITPAAGRLLVASDEPAPNDPNRPIMISYGLWQRRFAGDPAIVGQKILLNLVPHTVVGVTPRDFTFPPNQPIDVFAPESLRAIATATGRDARGNQVSALLRPGVTWESARAEMDVIGGRLAAQYRENEGFGVSIVPMRESITGSFRAPLLALLGALGTVMLLVCVNIANLQLVKLEARRRELAVRAALGASAPRLARHLLIENALLTALAGVVGLALTGWGMSVFQVWAPVHLPSVVQIQTGSWALLGALGVSLITGVCLGIAPMLLSSRVNIEDTLRQGGRQVQGLSRRRGQKVLVIAEVSLALVVLVAAGMLAESFRRLAATPMGFDTANLLTLRLQLPLGQYPDDAARARFGRVLEDTLQTVPGVQSATLWGPSMLGRARTAYIAFPEGAAADDPDARLLMDRHSVNPGALANLDIPVLRGRGLTSQDTANTPPVAVISEGVANRLWPGQDPIGKRMRSAAGYTPWVTVVGVARDSRQAQRFDLNAVNSGVPPLGLGPQYDAYFSYLQRPSARVTVALRVSSDVGTVGRALKKAVLSIDPSLPVFDLAMLDERLAAQLAPVRLVAVISSVYAGVALFLAVFGLFALLAHDVSQRIHEMGVRMALGAQRRDVLWLVLRQGLKLTGAGLLVGVGLGVQVSAVLEDFLFGVSPSDPIIYASISALLVVVALFACLIPARRATRFDPVAILRGE